ncbi:MAG: polyphenol oxidase family protein [Verrucomicrobiota bacterium]|nr:polyphenol oxidase family protein [Verrucomicrobiota bacterium]
MQKPELPFERFAALPAENCMHAFVHRVPGVDVSYDKAEVLARLDEVHREVRNALGVGEREFVTAQQVHGNEVAIFDHFSLPNECFAGCDGLITNQPNVCLGIYVADCCAVYLVDPIKRCIGLVHSGKKGSELEISARAIALMQEKFGSRPDDLIVQLSPCIRPPHYEIDFASAIVEQCRVAGVKHVHDCQTCTACDLERYYSYRLEKGKTGRMLALLALR